MKAIIVAGGEGKRLRPLTVTMPKPMIRIGGIPILEYTVRILVKHGVTDIVLALCYLPQPVIDYFGNGSQFGCSITYTFEDPKCPLGTAGAILPAKDFFTETCIVTYADTLRDLDITRMIEAHRTSGNIATLNVYKHTGENFKSSIIFDGHNLLVEFNEQAQSTTLESGFVWSNGSFYIFEPSILEYVQKDIPTDFARNVFPQLLNEGKSVSVLPTDGYFIDIGTLETLKRAEDDIAQGTFTI